MVKREIKGKYLIAFLLTASVFVLGIFFGMFMSDFKINKVYSYERDLMNSFFTQDVQDELLASDPCRFVGSGLVSQELFSVGDRLSALEKDLGKTDENVLSLKRYYTILQIKDYLFYKKVNEKCKGKFILNLFFYSNDPKKCDRCEDQGFVLSYVKAKNDRIRTYSFDVDLGVPAVKYLIDSYNLTGVPAVVFSGIPYSRFISTEEMDKMVGVLR